VDAEYLRTLLILLLQVPPEVHVARRRRGAGPRHRRSCRCPRRHCPVRRDLAALRLPALPPAQGSDQIRTRGHIAAATRYAESSLSVGIGLTIGTARVAVHFNAVTDKFTPHDTTISIVTAAELSDSALASACSLHTAAPSSSSSNSSRHKLDEITEDNEEGQSTAGDSSSTAKPTPAASIPAVVEPSFKTVSEPVADAPEAKIDESKLAPEISHVSIETVTESSEKDDELPTRKPERDSFKNYDALFENGPDPRLSSQTARPTLSDMYGEMYAELYEKYNKPKVKLGPRPKASLDIKRPHTSGNGAHAAARPVSSLPAGLRAANRKPQEQKRPKSRDSSAVPSIALPPPPPVPPVPEIPASPSYPKSPASVRSMPVHAYGGGRPGVTPEKQRLMKALQLRKKQMEARKEREAQEAASASAAAEVEEVATATEPVVDQSQPLETSDADEASTTAISDEPIATVEKPEVPAEDESAPSEQEKPALAEELDVGMTSFQSEADDVHSAASACSPTSAQTQGSSVAPSTRPSSISEDDQQVQNEAKPEIPIEGISQVEAEVVDDEDASVESTPTVVPEAATPVSTTNVAAQADPQSLEVPEASASDDLATRRNKRKSMIIMPTPSDSEDRIARRRTKRESLVFVTPPEADAAETRRQKRESMILSAPFADSNAGGKNQHRFTLDPTLISAENSEAEYLSDDSFMEELRGAKVEEAMPVSVSSSRSPVTPYFPRKASMSERTTPQRSTSQQHSKQPGRLSPEQLTRKSSGPWLTHTNSDTAVVAKKINVSSGISQRIKALAEKSNRDSSASVSPLSTPDASVSIISQRKSSFFTTPPSGNSPPGKLAQRFSRASFIASKSSSPTPDNKPVLQPPPTHTELSKASVYNVHGSEKPESVQVTARIVRDPRVQKPNLTMPTDKTPLELHKSPIIIDHQKSTRPSSSSKPNPPKTEPLSPRPPSSSHTQDAGAALPRSSSESSWRSFGRRMSESKGGPPRSLSAHSLESSEEKVEKKEKKDSRTSKLFKRMSSAASMSRKNSATSSVQEEPHTSLPSLREPPPPVQVGDLNIQFPDTLVCSYSICLPTSRVLTQASCGNEDGSRSTRLAVSS
jgi:hypothetical protein